MSCIQVEDDNKHAFILVDLNKKFRFSRYFRMLTNISRIMLYCWSWWRIWFFVFFSTNGSLLWEREESWQRPFWTIVCLLSAKTLANIPPTLNYSHSIPPLRAGSEFAESAIRGVVKVALIHLHRMQILATDLECQCWFILTHHLVLDAVLLYNPTIVAVTSSSPSAVANDHHTQRWSMTNSKGDPIFPFGPLLNLVLPSLPELLADCLEQLKPREATDLDVSDVRIGYIG